MAKKKTIEHPEAPSGAVKLYNYKTPFMPTDTGIGFQGVLLHDAVEDKVQCSVCAWWGPCLWRHISAEHPELTAATYKHRFGLNKGTALLSEGLRSKFILAAISRAKAMGKDKLRRMAANGRKNRTFPNRGKPQSMEVKNGFGSCPEQLLERIRKVERDLGRRPSCKEFVNRDGGALSGIKMTFGSWNGAMKILGYTPWKRGVGPNRHEWNKKSLIFFLKTFKETHGRSASYADHKRKLMPSVSVFYRHFPGGFKQAIKLASK